MKAFGFALRMFRRDWRSGELRLLSLSLIVAVAAVTAVGFFTNRIERALELQAAEILAADLVMESSSPLPENLAEKAGQLELATATTLSFPSVVLHDDQTQLVNVKAVSPTYPLRGELRIRQQLGDEEQIIQGIPEPGTLWAESRLLVNMQLAVGDRISLGEMSFLIAGVLSRDSGESSSLFRLGPRVLLGLSDIPATELVNPASRVRHTLLIAGARKSLDSYRSWVKQRLPKGVRIEDMSNARPELKNALDRGSSFLGLAALAAVLVAGAAVALSTRRFVDKQSDVSAIMRCLGASRRFILQVLLLRLLLIALLACLLGSIIGFFAQFLLVGLVGDLFSTQLPAPDLYPVFIGLGTGLITLMGFTLAPMARLSAVPPLRVLRRELGAPPVGFWLLGLTAFAALAILMLWQAGDAKLAAIVIAGSLGTIILMLTVSRLLVFILTPLRQRTGTILRYGLAGLARNPGMTAIQLTGFGIGILALLLLAIVRVDLLSAWEKTIPANAPNHFLINIQPHEVTDLANHLSAQGLDNGGLYPMLRARLTHINQQPVAEEDYPEGRPRRLVSREFNLSWAEKMQEHNTIIRGQWWREDQLDQGLFSVEIGIAETLGIKMGDQLRFNIAGVDIEGRVNNLRLVEWDSFQPNFFVIGTPGLLRSYPSTYITSFYLPAGDEKKLSDLVRNFPSVTLIDVSSIMQQIREIIARGSMAVEYVFLFTLLAGLLVLYAGIQASRDIRRQESAILRTMGLKRSRLIQSVAIEFITLGVLAGLLASLCATLTGWAVSTELFGLTYQFNGWIWVIGTLGGAIGIGAAGVIATYPLVIHPPLHTLREG